MSNVPSTPAEMQAFILERLRDRRDEVSDFGVICDIVGKKLATSVGEQIPQKISEAIEVRMLDRAAEWTTDVSGKVKDEGLLFVFGAEEADPVGYASLSANAAAIFIGASLGADHTNEIPILTNPLTPIEAGVLKHCALPLVQAIEETKLADQTHDVIDVRDPSNIGETAIEPQEVVTFRFELIFGETSGTFGLHVPKNMLTSSDEPAGAENDNLSKWHDNLRDGIMQMNVGVKAIVKLNAKTLGNLNSLDVGDIIELPADNPHTAILTARDKTLFIGQFGKVGNRYSVRVERPDQRKVDLVEHIMSTM